MHQTFGAFLRHLRRRNGMTQSELAARLGYSRSLIAALETDRRLPNVETVIAEYVPALALHDRHELARQLVELATRAHGATQFAENPRIHLPRPSISQNEERHAQRVPTPPMRLLGREREVQMLCDRFLHHDVRMLTLTGPPGVGKTTLALAVAARLQYFLPEGACFVPLAGINNGEHVAAVILDALGITKWTGGAFGGLVANLRRKEMLLVLDNFEQILGAAPQVARLLEECAGMRVLVTSRERLHLRAEHIAQVQRLSLDAAVELFLARAGAVNADLLLAEIDRPLVEAICRRLDCLPLSIELCAAQADFFTFAQILERFDSGTLDTLVDGAADLPDRHRTLRATLQASYSLLNADERALLQMLSVFAGGCTLAAIEEMWTPEGSTIPASEILRALVAKSLVQIETISTGEKRVRLLEAVREFARERLEAEGDPAALRARHFDVTLRMGRLMNQHFWTFNGLRQMNQELENVQAGLEWAFEQGKWMEVVLMLYQYSRAFRMGGKHTILEEWHVKLLPMAHELGPDVEMLIKMNYCYHAEGDRALQRTFVQAYEELIDACVDPLIKAIAIINGTDLGVQYADAEAALKQAVALAREGRESPDYFPSPVFQFGNALVLPYAIFMHGCYLVNHGCADEATTQLHESRALFRAVNGIGDPSSEGFLGRAALIRGEETEAIRWYQQAIDSAVSFGDARTAAIYHSFLGQAILFTGDIERARAILARAWVASEAEGDPFVMQIAAIFHADLAFIDGDIDAAHQWLAESIALSARSSRDLDWRHIHRAMLAARLAAVEGNDEHAARLYGFMQAYLDSVTIGPYRLVRDTAAATMAEVRVRMGEEAYQRAYRAGRALPSDIALGTLLLPGR